MVKGRVQDERFEFGFSREEGVTVGAEMGASRNGFGGGWKRATRLVELGTGEAAADEGRGGNGGSGGSGGDIE